MSTIKAVWKFIKAMLFPDGGTHVTPDSRAGKAEFLAWSLKMQAKHCPKPLLIIDPKGDLCKFLLRHSAKRIP